MECRAERSAIATLRHATRQANIKANSRSQNEVFSNMGSSIKSSAGRLGRMAQQGNKLAILKLAGILVAVVLVLYWIARYIL